MRSSSVRWFVGLACAVVLAGCGEPRFDASNAEAAGKSFQTMTADMTELERQSFMARATAVSSMSRGSDTSTPTADTMWRGIDGMTKAEIIAKANEMLPTKTADPAE